MADLVRISADPILSVETGDAKVRISADPILSVETGGAKFRLSAMPILIIVRNISSSDFPALSVTY
jgi:hypothetical protein